MKVPLRRRMCALIMGIKMSTMRQLEKTGKMVPMPRKRGDRVKFSKEEVLKHLYGRKVRVYRKEPLPEYLNSEIALVYSGFSPRKFKQLSDTRQLNAEWHTFPDGKKMWVYSKAKIDEIREAELGREYYCDGLPYYTRKAIKCKFFKTDRWIDTFIKGKCRRMHSKDRIIPLDVTNETSVGWFRGDVNEVIASGVDFKYRKKPKRPNRSHRRTFELLLASRPPVAFSSPVEQMEMAIRSAIENKEEARKQRMNDIRKKMIETGRRRAAIRNILTTGAENIPVAPGRDDFLRYATDRQIVTFLISSDKKYGRYKEYPHTKDERIFLSDSGKKMGRKSIPPVFARAIMNSLTRFNKHDFEKIPAWVIIVSSTSMITDPMFHEKLREVPQSVGAVGSYGYGYILPDGSWDRSAETYGGYWAYSEITGSTRRVDGLTSTGGSNMVEMLDGPFIAIRGEHMQELRMMRYFMKLGDARGLLVPVVSAICRRLGIHMMQIPVDCWASEEFEVRPGTPEMNLAVELTSKFVSLTDTELNNFIKNRKII